MARRGPCALRLPLPLRGLLLLSSAVVSYARAIHTLTTTYEGGWIQDGVMFDVRAVSVGGGSGGGASPPPDGIVVFGLNILTPLEEKFCVELYTKAGSFGSASSNADAWTFLGSFSIVGNGPTSPTTIPPGAFDPIVLEAGETRSFYVTTQDEKMRYTKVDELYGKFTGDVYSSSEVHYDADEPVGMLRTGSGGGGRDRQNDRDRPYKGKETKTLNKLKRAINKQARESDGGGSGRRLHRADAGAYQTYAADEHGRMLDVGGGIVIEVLTGVAKNYPFLESWPHRAFNGALLYAVGTDNSIGFLTDEQRDEATAARRGPVTCDADAMPPENYPSAAPSDPLEPTGGPTKSPTATPSDGPTDSPTETPTALEDTIRKVATTLHGGLKQSGCMFDVRVPEVKDGGPSEGLTVLAVEMSTFLEDEICVEVYTKSGTYEGYENDVIQDPDGSWSSPTWRVLGAATVTGRGEKEPTHLPIGSLDKVFLSPGARQAFYVTMTIPEIRYTEPKYGETSGTLFSGSPLGHLELMVGSAVAYPFEEVWPNRIFNGAVVYALGEVKDGRYNEMVADARNRTCPSPTEGPTGSPNLLPAAPAEGAVAATVAATATPQAAAATTIASIGDGGGSGGADDVVDAMAPQTMHSAENPTESPSMSGHDVLGGGVGAAWLSGACPGTDTVMEGRDIEVMYEYAIVIDVGADPEAIVQEMENALHGTLMANKCGAMDGGRRDRELQDIEYLGFKPDPVDRISDGGCGALAADAAGDGQMCLVVTGGVTVVVNGDADMGEVENDIKLFALDVFSNPDTFAKLDVKGVAYYTQDGDIVGIDSVGNSLVSDDDGAAGDQAEQDSNEALSQNPGTDGAKGGNQDPLKDDEGKSKTLSTTGIVIICVLAATLSLVVLVLAVMHLRKRKRDKGAGRRKRSDSHEAFREFPDEDEEERAYNAGYGITQSSSAGYDDEPLAMLPSPMTSSPPPRQMPSPATPPPRTRSGASSSSGRSARNASAHPAIIVNEADDMSLFSSDRSKAKRFRPSRMVPPDSPNSRGSEKSQGSRGSNSSKRSVEFVKAGQSFGSSGAAGGGAGGSSQPEDTVDL